MKRRDFVTSSAATAVVFGHGSAALADNSSDKADASTKQTPIVDAHCHAGYGKNYDRPGGPHDPWTTFNDPEETLRKMEQAGIDRTGIFPIPSAPW